MEATKEKYFPDGVRVDGTMTPDELVSEIELCKNLYGWGEDIQITADVESLAIDAALFYNVTIKPQ